jgi:hypothetical protein
MVSFLAIFDDSAVGNEEVSKQVKRHRQLQKSAVATSSAASSKATTTTTTTTKSSAAQQQQKSKRVEQANDDDEDFRSTTNDAKSKSAPKKRGGKKPLRRRNSKLMDSSDDDDDDEEVFENESDLSSSDNDDDDNNNVDGDDIDDEHNDDDDNNSRQQTKRKRKSTTTSTNRRLRRDDSQHSEQPEVCIFRGGVYLRELLSLRTKFIFCKTTSVDDSNSRASSSKAASQRPFRGVTVLVCLEFVSTNFEFSLYSVFTMCQRQRSKQTTRHATKLETVVRRQYVQARRGGDGCATRRHRSQSIPLHSHLWRCVRNLSNLKKKHFVFLFVCVETNEKRR